MDPVQMLRGMLDLDARIERLNRQAAAYAKILADLNEINAENAMLRANEEESE